MDGSRRLNKPALLSIYTTEVSLRQRSPIAHTHLVDKDYISAFRVLSMGQFGFTSTQPLWSELSRA